MTSGNFSPLHCLFISITKKGKNPPILSKTKTKKLLQQTCSVLSFCASLAMVLLILAFSDA